MKQIKKMTAIFLALVMMFTMVACGQDNSTSTSSTDSTDSDEGTAEAAATEDVSDDQSDAEVDTSKLSIGVVMKLYDEFQNQVIDGAKAAAEEIGAKIDCVAPDDITDAAQQVQMIENFISQGVDILLVDPNIADSVLNVLKDATDKGIKVVLVDTDSPNFENPVTYVGTANYDAAYEGATEFASRLPEGANVVIATGMQGDDNHEKRSSGYKDAMEAAGCTVLDLQYCDNSADLTGAQVEDWIQKYGKDGIDAVMVTDDDAGAGAVQALKQNGLVGEVKVCSFNGFQVAIKMIKEGSVEMTIAQQPYEMGYESVMCGLGAIKGETYDRQIPVDVEIIDSSNCDEYLS